eukprot:3853846-Amphidinium_carterae.1
MATAEQVTLLLEQNQELHQRIEAMTNQMAALQQQQQRQQQQPAPVGNAGNAAQRGAAAIDTRHLGKPDHFDGSSAAWKDWSTVVRAYTGAVNGDLPRHTQRAETTEDPVDNLSLSVDASGASQTLYYILIMLCKGAALTRVVNSGASEGLTAWRALCRFHEPKTATRHASMLIEVLNFDFQGDPQERIAAFDRVVHRYEMAAGETVSSRVKVGLVLKQLPDGALKQHVVLNLEKWDTYEKLRMEIENISRAQLAAQHSSTPMDLAAINATKGGGSPMKGGKGKDKGKDKGGGKGNQDACRICGRTGHWAKDCWQRDKGKGKGKGKSKGKENAGGKGRVRCWKCGKNGHLAKDCHSGAAHSLEEAQGGSQPAQPASTPVSSLYLSALHQVQDIVPLHSVGESKRKISIGIDSGAAASVIMDQVASDHVINKDEMTGTFYESASGTKIKDRGQIVFGCNIEQDGAQDQERVIQARRATVSKNLLSVYDLVAAGHRVVFDRDPQGKDVSHMVHKVSGLQTRFHHTKRVWEIHVEVASANKTRQMIEAASNLNVIEAEGAARSSDWDGRLVDEVMVDKDEIEGDVGYDGAAGPSRVKPRPN